MTLYTSTKGFITSSSLPQILVEKLKSEEDDDLYDTYSKHLGTGG